MLTALISTIIQAVGAWIKKICPGNGIEKLSPYPTCLPSSASPRTILHVGEGAGKITIFY